MEDDFSPTRSSSSAPSDDPLDALIARQEAARAAAAAGASDDAEQEVDEDETTETEPTAERDPGDDDLEDDDGTDEAHTPEEDVEDEDDTPQERRHKKQAASASKDEGTDEQMQGTDSEDDEDRPLSRKQRGKLIQELRQELADEQEQKRRLEDSLKSQREEDERLNKEIDRALGTDEQFNKDMEAALNGDTDAQERVRIWKANREYHKKLVSRAQRDASVQFFNQYWEEVSGLPGVTEEMLRTPSLKDLLKSLYDAGAAANKDRDTEQVEKLQNEVATWRGRYRDLKAKSGGKKKSPLEGGGATSTEQPFDWRKKYFGPDGLPTDEAEAIVAQYGFEALKNPKLIKAR